MRYLGNKENIIEQIDSILEKNGITGERFFDFFSGTTNVGRYYKQKGYQVDSCDLMYTSYCFQKSYIENNEEPTFTKLLDNIDIPSSSVLFTTPLQMVVDYLNTIEPVEGFIYSNYTPGGTSNLEKPRMYFSDENGKIIDGIRIQIEDWKNKGLITEMEYYILITCLIETVSLYSNVSGVYAAFRKDWDPRSIKRLFLRTIQFVSNNKTNQVYCDNSMNILDKIHTDILYLDPPYNERQYFPNYHILETISRYDNPIIKGVTGMRDYSDKKSSFCNPKTGLKDLETVVKNSDCRFLVLSYNSEGIMNQDDIIEMFSKYGKVTLEKFEYQRFKSNNNGLSKTKKTIFEELFILKK